MNSLPTGDIVLFKRGGVYRGTLYVNGRNGITFGAYGTGDPPILSGSEEVTGAWSVYSGDIWKTTVTGTVKAVYVGDMEAAARMTLAREPNANAADPWFRNTSIPQPPPLPPLTGSATSIVSNSLNSSTFDWTGGQVVVRASNWNYFKRVVTSHIDEKITFPVLNDGVIDYDLGGDDWGFFLSGKLDVLNAEEEWYHDGTFLYLYWSGGTPNEEVRVVSHDRGIYLVSCSDITIKDLHFAEFAEYAVVPYLCADVTIENCFFQHCFGGVSSFGGSGGQDVTGCTFVDLYDSGINTGMAWSQISNNTFRNIGMVPGEGTSGRGYMALRSQGAHALIENNLFDRIGYTAMDLKGDDVTVRHNYIRDALLTLNDGGGIFFSYHNGVTLEENIIRDVQGEFTSTSTTANYGSLTRPIGTGLYFDNEPVEQATLEGNTVSGCVAGIHVDHRHETQGVRVVRNTLFNNATQLSLIDLSNMQSGVNIPDWECLLDPHPDFIAAYDSEYQGNILYAIAPDQTTLEEQHVWWRPSETALCDYGTFGSASDAALRNYHFNPYNEVSILVYPYCTGSEEWNYRWRHLDHWRTERSGEDALAISHPRPQAAYAISSAGPDLIGNGSFDTGIAGWTSSGGCTSHDATGALGGGGALKATMCTSFHTLIGQNLSAGDHVVRFTVKASSHGTLKVRLRPYYEERHTLEVAVGPNARQVELVFRSHPAVSSASAGLHFFDTDVAAGLSSGVELFLDNVSLTSCTATPVDPHANHILRYNCPLVGSEDDPQNVASSAGILTVPGDPGECWSNVQGDFYAAGDEIPINEWASIVLFRFAPPQDLAMDVNNEYIVSANETWTEHRNVTGRIIVQDGATLTIDGAHIGFAASTPSLTTNLTVEPGGTLLLRNGATLRDWMGCDAPADMWDGLKVYGVSNAYDHAPEQGRILMESGARIANAKCGVLAGFGDVNDPGPVGFDDTNGWVGGSVALRDALFENNVYDVVLHPGGYHATSAYIPETAYYNGISLFQNCTFRTTRALNDPSLYPKAHVRLTGRDAAVFHQCTFANDRTDIATLTSAQLGHGIEAFNSSINAVSCTPNCGDPDVPPNTFRQLDHAIHGTTGQGSPYNFIRNGRFQDNICAVYISGETGIAIRDNEVMLGKWYGIMLASPDEEFWLDRHRGLFTTRSNGVNIRDNTLVRSAQAPASAELEGIVVGYTEDGNEVVFHNTVSNLSLGFVGEGISADVNGGNPNTIGLQFQCNTNQGNATNLMSRMANGDDANEHLHTIRGIQGNPDLAAGNTFDQNTDWDFDKNTTQVPIITYYHDPSFSDQLPVNVPADIDPLAITGADNACGAGPGGLVPGGGPISIEVLKPTLISSTYEYGTLRYQYEQLIDGGNTDEVVQEITNAWPQDVWDLRDHLLGLSPYLSVDALKGLVDKSWVPVAIKTEVCVANPEATQSDGFLDWAENNATYPLPSYALDAIEASWDERTYRFTLETQLAARHTRMTQAMYHLLELYSGDSVRSHPDSLRWVWQQLRTNGARYAETGLLMRQGRYNEALDVLNAMPQERDLREGEQSERMRMITYVELLADAHADERSAYRLNAQEVQQLQQLVGEHYDRPAVWAGNLLCAQYHICRSPYTGGAPTPKSATPPKRPAKGQALAASPALRIHPNPANNWAAFSYHLPGNHAILQLRIRDAQGRVVHTLQAGGEEGQVVWDSRRVAPGVYTVELLREGNVQRTERLIIQP